MSAERLREAAALMRERAEGVRATAAEPDQWFGVDELVAEFTWGSQHEMGDPKTDAKHIASWHPAVALAVADWLRSVAVDVDKRDNPQHVGGRHAPLSIPDERAALAVADAYLGSES